jgi:hypothetical protein
MVTARNFDIISCRFNMESAIVEIKQRTASLKSRCIMGDMGRTYSIHRRDKKKCS